MGSVEENIKVNGTIFLKLSGMDAFKGFKKGFWRRRNQNQIRNLIYY